MFVSETRVSCFRFSSAEALPSCPQLPVARVSTHVLLLDLELNPKTSFSSLMKGALPRGLILIDLVVSLA